MVLHHEFELFMLPSIPPNSWWPMLILVLL